MTKRRDIDRETNCDKEIPIERAKKQTEKGKKKKRDKGDLGIERHGQRE